MLMKHNLMRIKQLILIFLLLALPVIPVYADDFMDGVFAGQKGDHKTAIEKWTPIAEQGHAEAQYFLGVIYFDGKEALMEALKGIYLKSK